MVDNCPKCNSKNTGSPFCPTCGFQLKSWELTNENIEQKEVVLPKSNLCNSCSYTILDVHRSCPNCGEQFSKDNTLGDTDQMQERVATYSVHPKLRAVSLENVKHQDLELNSDVVILNREKIDPGDKSISVEEHALLYKENGDWFISNKASNKALFVQLTQDIKLTDGALLLVGNSKFYKFKS